MKDWLGNLRTNWGSLNVAVWDLLGWGKDQLHTQSDSGRQMPLCYRGNTKSVLYFIIEICISVTLKGGEVG